MWIWVWSNGPNLLNLKIAQYAKSVRGSNGIQIWIWAYRRARNDVGNILGQKSNIDTPATCRHRRWVHWIIFRWLENSKQPTNNHTYRLSTSRGVTLYLGSTINSISKALERSFLSLENLENLVSKSTKLEWIHVRFSRDDTKRR